MVSLDGCKCSVVFFSAHTHKYFHFGCGQQIQVQTLQLLSLKQAHGELDILSVGTEGGGETADDLNSSSSHAFFFFFFSPGPHYSRV